MRLRLADERGKADFGWLKANYTFSFANHFDRSHMGQGILRVLNQDKIDGGKGFGFHPHRDMEIVTIILDGGIMHRDNMGNETVITPGEIQRMSAGSGVIHSEMNSEATKVTELLQIWIEPKTLGDKPSYAQKRLNPKIGTKVPLLASPDGAEGSITIHANAWIHGGEFDNKTNATWVPNKGSYGYLHVAKGTLTVNGATFRAGDGAYLDELEPIQLKGQANGYAVLFELTRPEAKK